MAGDHARSIPSLRGRPSPDLPRFTPCRRREQAFELTQPGVRHRQTLLPMMEEHRAGEADPWRDRVRRMYQSPPEAILGLMAELEVRYGDLIEYLRFAGARKEVQERIKASLV